MKKQAPLGLRADGQPRKSRAGRPRIVESREDRDAIFEKLLTHRPNYAAISLEHNITETALRAYERRMVPRNVRLMFDRSVQTEQMAMAQLDALLEARKLYEKLSMLADGFHRWLLDPEDPTRYTVSPRDNETTIIWEREVTDDRGRTTIERHKDSLMVLLQQCRVRNELRAPSADEIKTVEVKFLDPRKGMIDLFSAAKPTLEMLGKAVGQIRPDPAPQINVFFESKDGRQILEVLYAALSPYPEALAAAGEALRQLGGE